MVSRAVEFRFTLIFHMGVKVPLPIKIQVDNMGTIWLANNSGVSEQTKHVDI